MGIATAAPNSGLVDITGPDSRISGILAFKSVRPTEKAVLTTAPRAPPVMPNSIAVASERIGRSQAWSGRTR
jgi:hypothetical protein